MKKLLSLILCLCILLSVTITANANDDIECTASITIDDQANLLTATQEADLAAKTIKTDIPLTVVIVTVNTLGSKSPEQFANDYYDSMDRMANGILLLLSMEYRDWYVLTDGEVHQRISDGECEDMVDEVLSDLSAGNYHQAFGDWLSLIPDYLDNSYKPTMFLIALLIGLVVGGIVIWIMRSNMNTAKPQPSATNYLKNGSFHLNTHLDFYLYSRITKTAKPKNTSSGGGGGSRGGAGGKF